MLLDHRFSDFLGCHAVLLGNTRRCSPLRRSGHGGDASGGGVRPSPKIRMIVTVVVVPDTLTMFTGKTLDTFMSVGFIHTLLQFDGIDKDI